MNRRDPSLEAADAVIWVTSCILAALIGIAIAFTLWARLHSGELTAVYVALGALALGTLLVGLALERQRPRAFVMILGFTVVLAYFFGAPGFARLIGP